LICRELAARGVTLLEADTDGVYFAAPDGWDEADERRVVGEVASLLPPLVQLEFEGRYAAMLSHEPKNYALLGYDGSLLLRGVAFRSSRAEPFGEAFLRRAVGRLLEGDVEGVRDSYVATLDALRRRRLSTAEVCSRVRLTKTSADYMKTRDQRRELPYEAMLACARTTWTAGERIRVYRGRNGSGAMIDEVEDEVIETVDRRDYDYDHYERVLRETFAVRLARAFTPVDYEAVFEDPEQLSLFARSIGEIRTILTQLPGNALAKSSGVSPRVN
jgi:DNA polymerase, archaea type